MLERVPKKTITVLEENAQSSSNRVAPGLGRQRTVGWG
jgi:hypothetical protein